MKVIYDNIVYNLQSAGGISTYWTELAKRLYINDDVDIQFINGKNDNLAAQGLNIDTSDLIQEIKGSLLLKRFINPRLVQLEKPFIFHSSYNRICTNSRASNVTTVHDFVHEKFYSGPRMLIHRWQKGEAIRQSKKIITVSENTKKDLLYYYPFIKEENVTVIWNGVSDDFYIIPDHRSSRKPFLLFVGSREKYKNFDFVVKLVKELPEFDLGIVGSALTKTELHVLETNIPKRYNLFRNINNSTLNNLYNSAYALLYPSFYEGFGIPLLEAMKAGLPFIALKTSSIPEVAGEAGSLQERLDIDAFKDALNNIALNRSDFVAKGLEQVAKFSWDKCYKETLTVYSTLQTT